LKFGGFYDAVFEVMIWPEVIGRSMQICFLGCTTSDSAVEWILHVTASRFRYAQKVVHFRTMLDIGHPTIPEILWRILTMTANMVDTLLVPVLLKTRQWPVGFDHNNDCDCLNILWL
jgi:hypothetical protein